MYGESCKIKKIDVIIDYKCIVNIVNNNSMRVRHRTARWKSSPNFIVQSKNPCYGPKFKSSPVFTICPVHPYLYRAGDNFVSQYPRSGLRSASGEYTGCIKKVNKSEIAVCFAKPLNVRCFVSK